MGSAHLFFRLDLQRLRGLMGSRDEAFARKVIQKQADEIENNDGCFEDSIEEGICPDTETAIREILAGTFSQPRQTSMYGYALKIICEHIGKQFGYEVGSIRAQPYASQLAGSGPPIAIPYSTEDFPGIGFLALADIGAEIDRIDSAPRTLAPVPTLPSDASTAAKKAVFRSREYEALSLYRNDENLVLAMEDYRKTLEEALNKRADIVSFYH